MHGILPRGSIWMSQTFDIRIVGTDWSCTKKKAIKMSTSHWTDDRDIRALRNDAHHRDLIASFDNLNKSIAAGIDRGTLVTIVDTITTLATCNSGTKKKNSLQQLSQCRHAQRRAQSGIRNVVAFPQ